jgi:hypothetical protein
MFVALFLWGFWGFVQSGSSGPPAQPRGLAFAVGGIGYLSLLFGLWAVRPFAAVPVFAAFHRHIAKNLALTVSALLFCFPAATFFIGFLLPPFILFASCSALIISVIRLHVRSSKEG